MAKQRVLIWNADCTPRADDDGVQQFVYRDQVNFTYNDDGTPDLDPCGNQRWTYKIDAPPPVEPPEWIPQPVLPPHLAFRGVPWKWIAIGLAGILLVGLLAGG